jgi:hypothetical protein
MPPASQNRSKNLGFGKAGLWLSAVGHLSPTAIRRRPLLHSLPMLRIFLGIRPDSGTCPETPLSPKAVYRYSSHAQGAVEARKGK